jgi:hypothetical protein
MGYSKPDTYQDLGIHKEIIGAILDIMDERGISANDPGIVYEYYDADNKSKKKVGVLHDKTEVEKLMKGTEETRVLGFKYQPSPYTREGKKL